MERNVNVGQGEVMRQPAAAAPYNPKVIWAVCFILVFSVMNVTMFNIAIPSISEQFGLLHSEVSWVTTGYSIIYAVGSLTYGKLADRFPMKRLISIGIVLFCVGSLVGFFAHTYAMLLTGRFIQSAGASAIPALAMLIPARLVPAAQRGRALGTIASTIAFASGIGPIVGGMITGAVSWNYLFLISLGTLLTVPLFLKWLPNETVRAGTYDGFGAALLGGAVVTLLLTVTSFTWWLPVVSAALFLGFGAWIRRAKEPFIQPKLFANRSYTAALVIVFLSGAAAFGIMMIIPTMLTDVNGLSATAVGLAMFPAAMAAAFLGRYGGKLADRRGNGFVVGIAMSSILAGLLLLSTASGHAAGWVTAGMAFVSVGFSFMQASLTNHVSGLLPKEQTGIGMGTFTLANFLSGSVSGAVTMSALDSMGGAVALNPFSAAGASAFGNVFLGMAAVALINVVVVYRTFRKRNRQQKPALQV